MTTRHDKRFDESSDKNNKEVPAPSVIYVFTTSLSKLDISSKLTGKARDRGTMRHKNNLKTDNRSPLSIFLIIWKLIKGIAFVFYL